MTVASAKVEVKCSFANPDDAEILNGPEVFGPARLITPGEPLILDQATLIGLSDESRFRTHSPFLFRCTATASPPPPGTAGLPLDSVLESIVTVPLRPEDANPTIACESNSLSYCWRNRWQLLVNWSDNLGSTLPAQVHTAFSDGAAFHFDDPSRQDVFVRLKDECAVSGHFAVGITLTTDRPAEVIITDTEDGFTQLYRRLVGSQSSSQFEDPRAFRCP
jgi:hypothetical protein